MRGFSFLAFCFLATGAYAQNGLPWYLGAPSDGSEKASAINAQKLVRSSPNKTVVIAVIDSGLRSDHPSLNGKLLPGVDMVSPERNPRGRRSSNYAPDLESDECPVGNRVTNTEVFGHGTGVASVIAGNGAMGVIGVSPQALIVPVKVMGACTATRKDLIDGLLWAGGEHIPGVQDNPNPARIINVSMAGGNTACNETLQTAINTLLNKGIIIVSAAGNTFGKPAREPSVCNGVIGVGSINPDKSLTYYSAIDHRILIYAPGGGSNSPKYGPSVKNRLRIASFDPVSKAAIGVDEGLGTSYSSALVTGVIAGLVLENPNLNAKTTFDEIRSLQTADHEDQRRFLNYEELVRLMRSSKVSQR